MDYTINQRIAQCRKLANLTQTEAAEKMGMKCSTYSQMERKGSINTERLLMLATIFDVHPDYLLYGKEERNILPSQMNFSPVETYTNNTMSQSNDFLDKPASIILSNKEENIIKIIRNLPKNAKEEIIAYIEKIYKENK